MGEKSETHIFREAVKKTVFEQKSSQKHEESLYKNKVKNMLHHCIFNIFSNLLSLFAIFGSRFQNWDVIIRPLGGNFTENQMFRSKIGNSSAQRSKNNKI